MIFTRVKFNYINNYGVLIMSKGEEIIEVIKARAEANAKKNTAMDEILCPKDVNLANLNEKNQETLEKISQMSQSENNLNR